ncbi:MAG: hypothetical protein GEV06_21520 [Luteitalea sp.]|nr:hypothetical protein [Luteitalea sp.]
MPRVTATERDIGAHSTSAGLCSRCRFARAIKSARGSTFLLCERSRTDPSFARYPALPVTRCAGFERPAGDDHDPNL